MRGAARRAGWLRSALLALVLAAAACSTPPRPAPPREAPKKRHVVLSTAQDDRRAGNEQAEDVAQQVGVLEDPSVEAYVAQVGQRLAAHAPGYRFDYTFRVVDQDEPNAFALPGGYIFVSRGLLVLANSEDELANVLGHEIVHVSRRHAAGRQEVSWGGGLLQWLQQGSLASYARGQEEEADRLGQGLAGLAGFDPQGMADFLVQLELMDRKSRGYLREPGFLDTHPSTRGRAASASARAHQIAWTRTPGIAGTRAEYLRHIDGLPVEGSASQGVFQDTLFIHPALGFSIRFPTGWDTVNSPAAVGAVAPGHDAQILLEHAGRGEDPERVAAADLPRMQAEGLRVQRAEPVWIGSYPGFRVRGRLSGAGGSAFAVVTWIAYRGSVFRVVGLASGGLSNQFEGRFLSVARSFRPLTPALLRSVKEKRVRIATAREGETLAELSQRTGNEWDIHTTAVMNAHHADQPLEKGELVKIAVSEPYRPPARGS